MSRCALVSWASALGLVWLAVSRLHAENGPPPASAGVRDWSQVARGNDREARGIAIGKLVRRLRPNMTRHQVEAIIGEPDQYDLTECGDGMAVGCAVYFYVPIEGHAVELLWVLYDVRTDPLRVVRIMERNPRD